MNCQVGWVTTAHTHKHAQSEWNGERAGNYDRTSGPKTAVHFHQHEGSQRKAQEGAAAEGLSQPQHSMVALVFLLA